MAHPRVLHLIGSLDRGGTEHQLVEYILRSPAPDRHCVATLSSIGPLADRLPSLPVLVGPVGKGVRDIRDDVAARTRLRRLIRARRIDLVHTHLSMSEFVAAASVPWSVPIVASRRGRTLTHDDALWYRAAEAAAHGRVRLMICNSRELARFTLRHDANAPAIKVIANGIDLERFAPSPLPADPVVAVIANLIGYKRHDLFLRAFELVARAVPRARALLIGDGPERVRLEKLAAELGLAERVEFRGVVEDPRPAIGAARLVALTSQHEGLPNALLEAMAMGRPVIATPVGGVPELVRDGVDGLLVQPTPVRLCEAITSLLVDDDRAHGMGASARERATSFGWERVLAQTEEVYRRILAGERFGRRRVVV